MTWDELLDENIASDKNGDDLISRQAAIREYQEVCNGIKCSECPFLIKVNTEKGTHLITDCKLEAFLYNLPSAQPELIRCKDCKYRDENWRRVSVRWLPCMDVRTGSNWYCGSAERGDTE